ncbi:hypothetical protein BDN72DRAFT_879327 [Pluteus cervinus]|uniref:Uncharacterized protein n=1 Tax=Pluteus cervinus TaxID=181527 RepID=A0ACD3AQ72_9AGAR|nr:hypothetical protein BDN72DRAFT_879327 [Pluteus cervinus]
MASTLEKTTPLCLYISLPSKALRTTGDIACNLAGDVTDQHLRQTCTGWHLENSRLGLLLKNRSSSVLYLSTGEPLSPQNNLDPDNFAEQTLMCTLATIDSMHMIMDFPLGQILWLIQSVPLSTLHDGSVASYLLQTNLLRLTDYLRHHPSETVSEKARTAWGIIQIYKPKEIPEQIQPYLADFAWTAMRRVNGFVKGNSTWLEFFRVGSWDLARGLLERDPKLWWINRLSVLEGTEDVSSPPEKVQALTDAPATRSSTPQTDSLKPSSLALDMV